MSAAADLRQCADDLDLLIEEVKIQALRQGLDPYRARSASDGGLLLAPLVAAQANLLAAISTN